MKDVPFDSNKVSQECCNYKDKNRQETSLELKQGLETLVDQEERSEDKFN